MSHKRKAGLNKNWVESVNPLTRKSDAEETLKKAKVEAIGKKYVRIPHPTIKNTFILKEKE
jgi:hypothetical protein